jgi:hypothetical protein
MKLRVNDQMHISSVQADTLKPGREIDVSQALGDELMKKHPGIFEQLDETPPAEMPIAESDTKADPAPQTKVEPPPATKVEPPVPNTADPAPKNKTEPPAPNKAASALPSNSL